MHFLRALVHCAFVPSVESAVPAGPPESGAVQEILHWQANTVGMMYSLIADAIKAKGALFDRCPAWWSSQSHTCPAPVQPLQVGCYLHVQPRCRRPQGQGCVSDCAHNPEECAAPPHTSRLQDRRGGGVLDCAAALLPLQACWVCAQGTCKSFDAVEKDTKPGLISPGAPAGRLAIFRAGQPAE